MWIVTCNDQLFNADHFVEIKLENNNIVGYYASGMCSIISERGDCYPIISEGIISNKNYVVVD